MSEGLSRRYAARRIVLASKGQGRGQAGGGFPPQPGEDLVFRGGRTLPQLTYKIFYVGKSWASAPLADAQTNLDAALSAAMSDAALNRIVGQYFATGGIETSVQPSTVLDVAVQTLYDKTAVHTLTQRVFQSGGLAGLDLKSTVVCFVLPPGAVLSSSGGGEAASDNNGRRKPGTPEAEDADSKNGLGGYHGSIHVQTPGGGVAVYYAVAVYSEGANGIPIPGWAPWENVCATLYHELNEARTDPDVEDAIRTGDTRWIGWNSQSGNEIGDFPIEEAGQDLPLVFKKVPVDSAPGTAPIQLLWSNRVHGPEAPSPAQAAAATTTAKPLVLTLDAAVPAPAALGPGIALKAPGETTDFQDPASAGKWSSTLSSYFDEAVARTQTYLKGLPSQFFNPAAGVPAGAAAEPPIRWPGFPRTLLNSGLPPDEQLQRAEMISGSFIGRLQSQDEYLEWFVHRDPQTDKITRIDFTCEGPEYWEFLATHEPKVLLALYQKHVSPDVQLKQLLSGKKYNRLNSWNTVQGAMHLIQPSNSLQAEIFIAADATILRKNADGSLKTDAQDLIQCAQYGEPSRASDPHIGDLVNGLARDGYLVSVKDPVGLYMNRPRLLGCATPDGGALTPDWFTIARGSEAYILRGVFQAPAGTAFVVGDVTIGGEPVAYGGQIAKLIDMGLTGVAYAKGGISDPAFPCVASASSSALATAALRRSLRVH